MDTSLLISPAAHGKTDHAIRLIRATLAAEPFAPVSVILPNQVRVAEFRRRLAAAGGVLGVNLGTFHTLYTEIMARTGQPRARLIDPIQVRLLRTIVDRLYQEGYLQHYAPLRAKPGFISALRAIIEELKRTRIEPGQFSTAVNQMEPRLQEIAAVYNAYQEWLLKLNWADSEGQGWLAVQALEDDLQLANDIRLLVVNGFDEFNPTQLNVLALLAQRSDQTLITITGDLEQPHRLAHRRFHRAFKKLTETLDDSPIPSSFESLAPSVHPDLAHVETNLFESSQPTNQQSPNTLHFIEAQTRAAETRAALRWIKTLIVQDGFKISEVAVIVRNLAPYRTFLEETAAEFGIPLRVIGRVPMIENPAVAALLSLLSIPALDWPRGPVLAAWRSPYFNWSAEGISPPDAAALDSATRLGHVISGRDQWQQAFDLLSQRKPPDKSYSSDEDFGARSSLEAGPEVRNLGEKFESFVARIFPPHRGTIHDYATFIEDLIGDDPFQAAGTPSSEDDPSLQIVACARENNATAERDVAALLAFKDVLRGLVLAESVLGTNSLEYRDFFTELRGAITAATYSASNDSGVLAASILDARGLSFRAVAILGLSEGEFPRVEREDPFLSEADRTALRACGLRIETKLHGDEVTLFYQAVTRARERLLFCRPYLADDGQPWEPSPYWLNVWHMFNQPTLQRVRPQDPILPEKAASHVEYTLAGVDLDFHLQRGMAILQSRLTGTATMPSHAGEISELSPLLATRYALSNRWSASKLETYGTCPFFFYITHALELEPRALPEEGYDARILGSMLHRILENTYDRATNPSDLDECLRLMPEIAADAFETAPGDFGFRPTPLWERQQEEITSILRQTITALANVSQGYTPRYFEPKFGMGNPPLILQTEIGAVLLHGYIDRIDEGPNGSLRIIDYKAGSTAITSRDLKEGHRLQLPIYALAARDALGLGKIASGFYWHIQKAAASSLKLEKYPGGAEAAFEAAKGFIGSHIKHIREGRFSPQSPKGGCPNYCPAIGFCWQYTAKGY